MSDTNRTAWITGAGGLLGNCFARSSGAGAAEWTLRPLTRRVLDLADFDAVRSAFARDKPGLIIHCAALSKSPDCQANPALARLLNVDVTRVLAELAADIPFVFFSTDLVFDGLAGNYSEADAVNPLSVYAETKVAAEQIVLSNPRHTVIRTSLNAGTSPTGDRAFDEQMRLAWNAGQTLRLFTDEFRCPIAATATVRAVWELLARNAPGLYHVAGSEKLSRWELGQLLAARWPELNAHMEPVSLKTYTGAPRSPDTSLNCAKAQALLNFQLPRFSEVLGSVKRETS